MTNYIPVFILNKLVILPNQEIKIDLSNDVSKRIIKVASKNNYNRVLVIAPKDTLESEPSIEDLPSVGVIARIKSKVELSNGNLRIVLRGQKRVRIDKYYQNKNSSILKCSTEVIELPTFSNSKETATLRKIKSLIEEYISVNKNVSNSIVKNINDTDDLSVITDIIASFLPFPFSKKLEYMECINPLTRANNLIEDLSDEINISNIDKQLDEKLQEKLENGQREYILREKIKEINEELGNSKEEEIAELIDRVNELNIDPKSSEKLLNEIKKYSLSSEFSPESSVIKNYIDTLINLPWNNSTIQNTNIKEIESILNNSHYGLEDVKLRIVEYVSILKKNKNLRSPIICLVGPPGVGKTSIAMSIAKSLNREFYKLSVGGLNDSTELTGSRRTYLGAAPGKIMQGIIKSKVNNPLILIDEVDKMVKDYKGDPASTLLEILDETQNQYFVDNYIEEPFDLSKVFFILTANDIENIPSTLLDRLEIMSINSYTMYEKVDIAKNYLIKNILSDHNSKLKISKNVIEYIVTNYTKESGVRELKRCLEKIIRKVLVHESEVKELTVPYVDKYLDVKYSPILPEVNDCGIANTLAYTNMGGLISHVEVVKYKGNGKVIITGNTGDILKESIRVIVSYLVSKYNIDIANMDLHFHFISASLKKDGPSAGVSIAVALMSLYKNIIINEKIAFTGEMSLKGDILPVGGLKEKITAAYAEGIKTIYIPQMNVNDLEKIDANVLKELDIKPVKCFCEIYDVLFK